jgi:hypothetical protein
MFRLFGSRSTRPAAGSAPRRLGLEQLEAREVPTIVFGLVGNRILIFNAANPRVILKALPITGLTNPSDPITEIDVRPASGGLYGRSLAGQLYLINPLSGFSTPVGNPVPANPNSRYQGFNFDPSNDQIRVVTNNTQNFRINPNFGTLIANDSNLAYKPGDVHAGVVPHVTGIASNNNVVFPQSTTLYGIDHKTNDLVVVGVTSPNDGQLTTVGSLGVDPVARVGFDIVTIFSTTVTTNVAYAAFQLSGQHISGFYQINLATGAATLIGRVGNNRLVNDIAVDLKNASGFGFPTLPPAASIHAGGGRMGTPQFLQLPPPNGLTDQSPNSVFAIRSEAPDYFNHAPIHVG